MNMSIATIIGSIGVSLLLGAFFLNLTNHLKANDKMYIMMNILGAGLSGYSSYLVHFFPFVILEGVWAIVAVIALVKTLRRTGKKSKY